MVAVRWTSIVAALPILDFSPEEISVTDFDYEAPAEFYGWRTHGQLRGAVTFRRFDSGAEAVRHAMEEVPSAALGGCVIEVKRKRFRGNEIRALYLSSKFPLGRA